MVAPPEVPHNAGRKAKARLLRGSLALDALHLLPRDVDRAGELLGLEHPAFDHNVYEEIKTELGIDFVPSLYKGMASKPGYLEANWNRVKAVMVEPGKLDRLTKEIIAVAVSAVNVCDRRRRRLPRRGAVRSSWVAAR